ncbi:GAP family protein [Glycomyces harbinensis]|uniref:Sap, sulfolipid-1-addressing protein n=1 Tax=Glycomyces harbinensis TaxID=58114 RepID=A0A1G7BFX1_9ACTN|nr:GAP family protein [Glycomyces harbinensis]SDE26011.1 Sap, sulfolipid-1-addressing protein [Glycomyces harbinensis]
MDLTLAASLAALALIDSTSFGTLLIPIWLLLAPGRVKAGRMLVYLGTIAVFYFAVGMAIVLGATTFIEDIGALMETRAAMWVQLVLGAGLLALSFRFDSKKRKEGGGRVARWRERALGIEEADAGGTDGGTRTRRGSALSLVGLAAGAATLEVATMLPYLAAIGMVTAAGLGAAGTTATMAGYCAVMILPALVLLGARLVARDAVEPLLVRINNWMTKNAASTTGWVIGIVGFLLARDAAVRLGLLDALINR